VATVAGVVPTRLADDQRFIDAVSLALSRIERQGVMAALEADA